MRFLFSRNHTRNVPWMWVISKCSGAWDSHPSWTWLAPGCEPLDKGTCFCPAIANRLVPFCEVPGCSCAGCETLGYG